MTGDELSAHYFNQSLARGLQILRAFNVQRPELSLAEITSLTGLNRTTTIRLLSTLSQLGYIERSPATKLFKPSLAVLRLGYSAISSRDLRSLAEPLLVQLSQKTNETVNMGVLIGTEVLYIVRLARVELLKVDIAVGTRLPAYCTSMGKMLLASRPAADREALVRSMVLEKRGPNTILSHDALIAELNEVAAQGFAVQDEEVAAGVRGVAAPIRDASTQVAAAINLAVPAARVSLEQLLQNLRPLVMETADQISTTASLSLIRATPGSTV